MNLEDILITIIEKLEKFSIDYMITGSFASNLHGIPRATFDVDIVISTDFEKINKFIKDIKNDFYADGETARSALNKTGIFNIVHFETGFKIDFIIKKRGEFYEKEFERRKLYKLKNKPCFFTSPEDTMLSKLLWSKRAESERQFQDALGVAKIQKENLDYEYLKNYAKMLKIFDLMERLLKELEKNL